MDLPESLVTAWQQQLTLERTNAAYYDALSAQAQNLAFPGTAAWMKQAANDERSHAQRVTDFLISRKVQPILDALEAAPITGDNLSSFFESAMEREQMTTDKITQLYYLADEEQDPMSCVYLHWFIEEQRTSQNDIYDIQQQLARLDPDDVFIFDHELGETVK